MGGAAQDTSGGKVQVFMAALPRAGVGALRQRSAGSVAAGDQPLAVMAPDGKFYTNLAADAAEHQAGDASPFVSTGASQKERGSDRFREEHEERKAAENECRDRIW